LSSQLSAPIPTLLQSLRDLSLSLFLSEDKKKGTANENPFLFFLFSSPLSTTFPFQFVQKETNILEAKPNKKETTIL